MASAIFNTTIETPKNDSITYNLSEIITTSGFVDKLSYTLISGKDASVVGSSLEIGSKSFGVIEIGVRDAGGGSAIAKTELTGFYANKAEITSKSSYDAALTTIRNNWQQFI